jgi:hypothetical protein
MSLRYNIATHQQHPLNNQEMTYSSRKRKSSHRGTNEVPARFAIPKLAVKRAALTMNSLPLKLLLS